MKTLDERIDRRWHSTWRGLAIIESKLSWQPFETMATLHKEHELRMRRLIMAGVSWRVIERHELDDPRLSTAKFDAMFIAATERRRTRLHSQQSAVQRRITRNAHGT